MNPRNTAAGSAGAGGYNFQAAAIAVSCAHLLAFRPLNWAPGVSSAPRTVEAETGGPGDDLRIVCEDGTAVEVQVKKGLTRGARLWDALLGLARGLAADPSLHGVLLVDSSSSRPVKEHLRQDVPRVAHGRTDGLREITRELVERLEESGVTDLTVLRRLTIAEKNLYPGADGHDGAIALLGNVVDDPKAAWEALEREAHAMMEGRARRDADALRRLVGVPAPAARQRPPRGIRLVKPADDLRPEDLRFQVLKPGEEADPRYRPFYPIYVPRTATVEPDPKDPAESYDEEGLARKLRSGEGFVLLGQPLDGKSRTIYEVLKRLGDRLVVVPLRSGGVIPDAEDLEALVGGREVVLLLEDLNDYVASGFPLRDLAEELDRHAAGCVVAATCRDGPEMSTITAAQGTDSGRFYEESLPLKLTLQPLSADEKGRLAVGVRKEWDPSDAQMYPTPGTIVMADALRAMRRRFDTLTNEQRDALRAMQLMAIGGVLPFTHERLRAVLAHPVLFDRPGLHLRDCLDALADNAFVRRPAPQDPADPEFAYLLQAVEYVEGRDWEGDLALLADVLDELADAEGLFSVGYAYHVLFEDEEAAAGCLWRALAHKPDFPQAWNNLGTALKAEGQREEAIECYARALQLRPDYLYARYNLGITYAQIGRHKDAVRCLRLVVGRGYPHDDEAWLALAQSLGHLGQYEEALEAFNRALETRPNYPEALHQKGVMLDEVGRPDEAIQAFETALKVRPRFAAAWHGKGVTYTGQQDHKKAAAAYRRAVRLDPNHADAWNNLSASLFALEDYDAALITAEKAIAIGHAEASAWYHKGRALTWLGRHEEAVDALDEAMRRGFDEPLAAHARGVALQARGWFHEGARWLCRARRAEWLWWYASRGSFPTDLTAKDAWSTLRAFSEPLDSDTPGRPVAVHRTASSRPTWPAHRYQEPPRDAGPAVPEWPTS